MSTAEELFSQSAYVDDVAVRLTPCVEILAITDAALVDGPHPGLLNFHNAFMRRFGAQLKWYRTNTDDHFKRMTAAKLDMVPFWFQDRRNMEQTLLGVEFKAGEKPKDMRVPSFHFDCMSLGKAPVGVFQMGLPLNAGYETVDGVLPLVREALAEFPLLSGYVGYTIYWDVLDFRFEKSYFGQNMPRLYMRHPGISLADPVRMKPRGLDGLMGVSWMTLLGSKALSQVGGLPALNSALQPPIQVQPLDCKDGGALIIAGPKPLIGDMAIGDDLPLYKDVGRAVRAARFHGQFAGGGMDNDVAHKWFMRFFGDTA